MVVGSDTITNDCFHSAAADARAGARAAEDNPAHPRRREDGVDVGRNGDRDDKVPLGGAEVASRSGQEHAAAGREDGEVDCGAHGHHLPPVEVAARHEAVQSHCCSQLKCGFEVEYSQLPSNIRYEKKYRLGCVIPDLATSTSRG